MTPRELERTLWSRFEEYRHFMESDAVCSAMVRLGEILHCTQASDHQLKQKWTERIESQALGESAWNKAVAGVQAKAQRIAQILSTGGTYEFEEFVLILTLRIELELALEFLRFRGLAVPEIDLSALDADIEEVALSAPNKRLFDSARQRVKKNWGLLLRSRWL